jgi:hypothetical protein
MNYIEKRTPAESLEIMLEISRKCSELGGPLSKKFFAMVLAENYLDLIQYQLDYGQEYSVDDFIYARQIQALYSKQDFIDLGVNKELVAFQKFLSSEELCRETNRRLEDLRSLDWDTSGILYLASQKISKILGNVPSFSALDLSFGPGANTSVRSTEACARTKLSAKLECSSNLIPVVRELLEELPMMVDVHKNFEDHLVVRCDVHLRAGKLNFVPKTSLEHRSIVVEPLLNSVLQKGIGSYMKKRLLRAGLDLRSQQRNQILADKGSRDGSLATVDLSSASDCISRNLVWNLLPYDWCCLLDCARSESIEYNNETILLEKFSSMGNAYTFELESLIFYSLAWAVCVYHNVDPKDVCVYGDDIIIPSSLYTDLSKVLVDCGFIVNTKKSFSTGNFRESCGADFLHGFDIRPYYLRQVISDRVLFSMHNWFVRHGELQLANIVHSFTHAPNRIYGPDGYGDGHLIGDYSPVRSRLSVRSGWEGHFFSTYLLRPLSFSKLLPGDYVLPSYSIYVRGDSPSESPCEPNRVRGSRGYKKVSIYTLTTSLFDAVRTSQDDTLSCFLRSS